MRRYVEWDSPWMGEKSTAGGGALLNLGGHGFDIAGFVSGEAPELRNYFVAAGLNSIGILTGVFGGSQFAALHADRE